MPFRKTVYRLPLSPHLNMNVDATNLPALPTPYSQGEMVQAKFGISGVALSQLETYTTAVLLATMRPPSPPRREEWRAVMEMLSRVSCESYRNIVHHSPLFLRYFKHATPEAELGNLNIGACVCVRACVCVCVCQKNETKARVSVSVSV